MTTLLADLLHVEAELLASCLLLRLDEGITSLDAGGPTSRSCFLDFLESLSPHRSHFGQIFTKTGTAFLAGAMSPMIFTKDPQSGQ